LVGTSIQEARESEGKRKSQKAENPRILERLVERKMTFQQLTDWYKIQPVATNKKYYDSLLIYWKIFNKVFGNFIVSKITTMDLQNYQVTMREQGFSDSYIDHHINSATLVIKGGYAGKKVSAETVQTFLSVSRLLKDKSNERKRILTVKEYDGLIKVLPQHIFGMLVIGFYTGMRKGEITKLTWEKVDFQNREIRLKATDTKNGRARTIPMGDFLFEFLNSLPKHNDNIFTYRGKPVNDIRNGLRKACEKAGILYGRFKEGGFVFHDLRHSFVTMMRKADVQQSVRRSISGHSTVEMDDRYDTVDKDDKVAAIARHEAYVEDMRSQHGRRA
jgi:integrase